MDTPKGTFSSSKLWDYDVIGFDVDHTFVGYNTDTFYRRVYEVVSSHLVHKLGYDKALLNELYDGEFIMRGLVLDLKHGNFLKLAHDGSILRASHGTKAQTRPQIEAIYGADSVWDRFTEIAQSAANIPGEVVIFENQFEMALALNAARVIDTRDPETSAYAQIWSDVWRAAWAELNPEHFESPHKGFYYNYQQSPELLLSKTNPEVLDILVKLRKSGKILFLLTTAVAPMTSFAMQFVAGPNWMSYFDFILTSAKKPAFFSCDIPFQRIDDSKENEIVTSLSPGNIYSGGNVADFQLAIQSLCKSDTPRVLYFGDSIRSDIMPIQKLENWDAVYVLEEIHEASRDSAKQAVHKDASEAHSSHINDTKLQRIVQCSGTWGSLFTDNCLTTTEPRSKTCNTWWAELTKTFSSYTISDLSRLKNENTNI